MLITDEKLKKENRGSDQPTTTTTDNDGSKSLRFDQVYWGSNDIGVTRLTHHLESRKVGMMKFLDMINLRANLESDYGKRLTKISNSIQPDHELGEFRTSLQSLSEELKLTGRNHQDLSYKLREVVGLKLKLVVEEGERVVKKQMMMMDEVTKIRDRKVDKLKKIFDKYRHEKMKFHHHKNQLGIQNKGQGEDSEEDHHQFRGQVRVGSDRLRELELEYRKLTSEVEESWRIWNETWRKTCQIFQDLEESRLKNFRGACIMYCKLVQNKITMDNESCDIIHTKFENINIHNEIQTLIQITTTGLVPHGIENNNNNQNTIPKLNHHQFSTHPSPPPPPRRPYHLFKKAISWSQTKLRTSFILDQPPPKYLVSAREMDPTRPSNRSPLRTTINTTTNSTMDFQDATIRSKSKLRSPSLLKESSWNSIKRPASYHHSLSTKARLTPPKFFVRATHPYTPTAPHELPLHLNQIIAVLQDNPDGWWVGTTLNTTTTTTTDNDDDDHHQHTITTPKLFPANFTVRIANPPSTTTTTSTTPKTPHSTTLLTTPKTPHSTTLPTTPKTPHSTTLPTTPKTPHSTTLPSTTPSATPIPTPTPTITTRTPIAVTSLRH